MADGWISIHRSITENWIWDEKPFDRRSAWIDLLMMVNHTDTKIMFDGSLVEVKRGQRITSIRKLSERWGWSTTKTTKFLTMLETDEMITLKKDTKKTLVTIVKYSVYQDSENKKVTQKIHRNNTEVTQKNTNNKENNENKDNKKDIDVFFESIWKLYPDKSGKSSISETNKKELQKIGFEEIERAIERYKKCVNDKRENGFPSLNYKNGSTFFKTSYKDYLDANYEEQAVTESKETRTGVIPAAPITIERIKPW